MKWGENVFINENIFLTNEVMMSLKIGKKELTSMPNILMLNFSAMSRSIGSTERRPMYAIFLNDNLQLM